MNNEESEVGNRIIDIMDVIIVGTRRLSGQCSSRPPHLHIICILENSP